MPETREQPDHRIRSYVHQRNRLTEGQQHAWDRWWPTYGLDVADLVAGTAGWDPPGWFGRCAPVLLEIGSGMGETTAALAAAEPHLDHVAVEVFEPGLAQLLMRIVGADPDAPALTNQRLLRGDAVDLLTSVVAPGSLEGVRLYFPDPWPKRRHHKRRLVAPGFVALAASRIRDGGTLHLATDWPDYAEQMRRVCAGADALVLRDPSGPDGWSRRPDWRPMTKFEARAVQEGRPVRDLLYTVDHGQANGGIPSVTG